MKNDVFRTFLTAKVFNWLVNVNVTFQDVRRLTNQVSINIFCLKVCGRFGKTASILQKNQNIFQINDLLEKELNAHEERLKF